MAALSTAFVVLAAFFWGVSGGIGGILLANGWEPSVVSFYRGAVGLVMVLAWLAMQPRGSGLDDGRLWFWSVVAGLGVAGNFAFYFLSMAEGSVAVAVTLMYCAPVFVYLISLLAGIERSSPVKWGAIMLVMLGIVLLTRPYDVGAAGVTAFGIGAGLLAGLSYAVFIFGFKFAAPRGSPQAVLAIAFATLVAVLIWSADADQGVAALSSSDASLFVALGVLGAGLSFFLYVMGLRWTTPVIAAIVAMIEPVTASLFGILLLGEALGAQQLLGMGLILVTVTGLAAYAST
ncbi:MAG: EamA family transporter [Gammaproteobacteria bacterium]|jgi:drug/metabolite transporter (DMT)-like permease|nr:EamA family transporter [Gammaproteobacteria bacterium]